ncbi:MAG: hypothetical protein OD811_06940 [Alphaproteobacteria bacterium]
MNVRADSDERIREIIKEIIHKYNSTLRGGALVKRADEAAMSEGRATGGTQRAVKKELVEDIGKRLVEATWVANGYLKGELDFRTQKYPIPAQENYIERILENAHSSEERNALRRVITSRNYLLNQDISVYRKEDFVLSVECKAFAENAMLKRIMVDAWLMKHALISRFPRLKFVLVQLENQMGGDYGEVNKPRKFGSPQSHAIMSYFDVELHIITLLEGKREVNRPIHKAEYFKPLKEGPLMVAVQQLQKLI